MEGERPSTFAIFASFTRMGAVLIGGGYALLPLLEAEVVGSRKWAKSEEMIDLYALAQLLPGVIAVNTSILIGNRLRGVRGTIAAAVGLTCVPFALIAIYAAAYGAFRGNDIFSRLLSGVQPAVAGMILGLGINMVFKTAKTKPAWALAVCSALLMLLVNPPFAVFILASIALAPLMHWFSARRAIK